MDHVNEKFEKQRVELDRHTFTNCLFDGCELVYSGGEISLNGCHFVRGSTIKLEGAAERTAKTITLLARPGSPTRQAMLNAFPTLVTTREEAAFSEQEAMAFAMQRIDQRRRWEERREQARRP